MQFIFTLIYYLHFTRNEIYPDDPNWIRIEKQRDDG